ncbi:hypothetical protein DYBT9275_03191 [Dyadobacter sp. CECT 9275]|uniref:DUF1800 domain-containing protein n=2 Tax=Dyadobacter helix TaxID=2822344 RepID=A0A916NCC6_9BACT|nr:hypothetical protein DYBT9275_03191 [Dyadobacter sp. CECT 9275]
MQEVNEVLGQRKEMDGTSKKELREEAKLRIKRMNLEWLSLMNRREGVFTERMALFWHGHFACRTVVPGFVLSYINTIRKHSLGNFGDMLMAISKEPAMLQFLNNQQNRKSSPNENFAREVMELFTLGRGNYTETDVKEVARAFTGWGFDTEGQFVFRERTHDNGIKNFLGREGDFRGEDVIRILLRQKQTARHVVTKLYQAFVSEKLNKRRIEDLADIFYQSGYDIGGLMKKIFLSDWFYEIPSDQLLIKSPVSLMAGIAQAIPGAFGAGEQPLLVQKVLGQVLFYPPNVAGWPGGRSWIDGSSLLYRMNLPFLITGKGIGPVKGKQSGDVNDITVQQNTAADKLDWSKLVERYHAVSDQDLAEMMAADLFAVPPSEPVMQLVKSKASGETDRPKRVRLLTLAFMGLPEYQVC